MDIRYNSGNSIEGAAMLKSSLILSLLVLGCNVAGDSENSKPAKITAGNYQYKGEYTGANYGTTFTIEAKLDEGGVYRGRFYMSDGTWSCLFVEANGQWAVTADKLTLTGMTVKTRDDCDQELSAPESIPDDASSIRNITANSYEEYTEQDNLPAQWFKFEKI